MPLLFVLGNFNKSAKLRVPKCRTVLSRREPRALLQLWMTPTSRQVAGAIWMPDSLLGTPFWDVTVLYYIQHSSYTIHNAAAGEREPVLRCSGDPWAQHGLSEDGISWWRQPTASQHLPPPPSNFPSESREADTEAPRPNPGRCGGPYPSIHCHAPPQRHQRLYEYAPFSCRGKPIHTLAFHAN